MTLPMLLLFAHLEAWYGLAPLPPVPVIGERQVSWRIRPKAPVSGVPRIMLHWLGLHLHWLVWLVLFSMLSALPLKGRFDVTL